MAHATAATSHSLHSTRKDPRGKRSLRETHPLASLHHRRRAPRARHLRYNRFTRPQRRTQEAQSVVNELLDSISVKGGYDGTQVFIKFEMDVSKQNIGGLEEIITKPLELLTEAGFLRDLNIFSGDSSSGPTFDINADTSFSASAHIGITVGFEIQADEFIDVIDNMNANVIASRSFMQFDDISAKFATTARVDGEIGVPDVGSVAIENATIAFAFGLGIVEISDKIFFSDIQSAATALKKNATWQHVAVMDINLPIVATIELGGLGLSLSPIISITSPDLFSPELPSMRIDLNLEELISSGESLIASILRTLTGGLGDVASGSEGSLDAGPLGQISGILDQFGMDFSDCFDEFTEYYDFFQGRPAK
jgi:hypothetical protein